MARTNRASAPDIPDYTAVQFRDRHMSLMCPEQTNAFEVSFQVLTYLTTVIYSLPKNFTVVAYNLLNSLFDRR